MRLSGAIKVCAQFSSITNVCVCDPLRCTLGARCNGVLEFAICLLEFISPFKPATEQTLVFFIAPFNSLPCLHLLLCVCSVFRSLEYKLNPMNGFTRCNSGRAHVLILQPGRVPVCEASAAKRGCAQVWTVSGSIHHKFYSECDKLLSACFFKVKCNIVKLSQLNYYIYHVLLFAANQLYCWSANLSK